MKECATFGQLPILEFDGKQIAQSCAIGRYLARQYGLAGKDEFEQAYVDSIVDFHHDGGEQIGPYLNTIAGHLEGDKVSCGFETKSIQFMFRSTPPNNF
jgi:glutathione S-transferase